MALFSTSKPLRHCGFTATLLWRLLYTATFLDLSPGTIIVGLWRGKIKIDTYVDYLIRLMVIGLSSVICTQNYDYNNNSVFHLSSHSLDFILGMFIDATFTLLLLMRYALALCLPASAQLNTVWLSVVIPVHISFAAAGSPTNLQLPSFKGRPCCCLKWCY